MSDQRLLVTGAAGRLGTMLRDAWSARGHAVRWTDRTAVDGWPDLQAGDLADAAFSAQLLRGVDTIVHLAACSDEAPWADIQHNNVAAVATLYDAAHRAGVRRVVFASSFHVMGFYPREERTNAASPPRPDSLYAVSKVFGETIGRYYWDKFGLETLVIRVGSCNPEPSLPGMLGSWLAPSDFVALVERAVAAEHVDYGIVHGVSDNGERWFDDGIGEAIGWAPQDSADRFRDQLEAVARRIDPTDPLVRLKGGLFAARGAFEDW